MKPIDHSPSSRSGAQPLLVGLGVSLLASVLGYVAPPEHAATLIGLVFLGATYWLCLRGDEAQSWGLSLGGLLERAPLQPARLMADLLHAGAWALGVSLLVLPAFTWGFVLWYHPETSFSASRAWTAFGNNGALLDLLLGHLLVVALPEEAFFRGYLQSALQRRWGAPLRWAGAQLGWGLVASSALFALGHVVSVPVPARLAVFFPSLLFGWLRERTGGIGASVFFHAICNVYAAFLAAAHGFTS